jgi:hypothetical protein
VEHKTRSQNPESRSKKIQDSGFKIEIAGAWLFRPKDIRDAYVSSILDSGY